tara:strand:+ start:8134 stop:8322 length:189 start_codon:yes stop_codon:yes gene_type:complete
MTELITNLTANLPAYIEVATQIVGTFAVIATMTPNSSDNAIVDFLAKIVNFFAGNFGKSSNA